VGLGLLLSTAAAAAPEGANSIFDFHSGFWMNLHHFVYAEASSAARASTGPSSISQADASLLKRLEPAEQATWNRLVYYYTAHYIQRDLLLDDGLTNIKEQLELAEASQDLKDANIPGELKSLLLQAAPIYRSYWWKGHNAQNKRWIAQLRPLIEQHGRELCRALAVIYDSPWPMRPVRVETVAYANWAGAYTTLSPTQPTVSTTASGNQGTAALEILLHESSHGLVRKLRNAIAHATSALPGAKQKAVSETLWHAVLFYTAGELIAEDYPGYTPYADVAELWVRAWPEPIHSQIIQDWKPHMEGSVTLSESATRLVNDLASSQR
jgi:hypothetical protein